MVYLRLPYDEPRTDNLKEQSGIAHQLSLIRSYVGARTFLPNLQLLYTSMIPHRELEFASIMLLGPKLKTLRLLDNDWKTVETLVVHANKLCPNMRMLETLACSSSIDPILPQLQKLEHFRCHSTRFPEGTVSRLARLPNLRDLHILTPYVAQHTCSCSPQPNFVNLERLTLSEIQDWDLISVSSFFNYMSPGALSYLDLRFDMDGRDVAEFNRIFEVIGEHLSNLQTLCLYGWGPDTAGQKQEYNIQPLLYLRRLRSLTIQLLGMSNQITNEDLPRYGAAWPNLTVFIFFQSPYYRMRPGGLTLTSLDLFARHFPNLSQLALELDATYVPSSPVSVTRSVKRIGLDLWRSLIGKTNKAEVAAYIARVYPNCTMRHTPSNVSRTVLRGEERARWQEVEAIVSEVSTMTEP